ncbi:MAG: T9SS type A sorting domain-containing protein [Bacteroidia bacterium]|nr:T9SS type A sorting domain-containing protein [Bacteroidia bacterium]
MSKLKSFITYLFIFLNVFCFGQRIVNFNVSLVAGQNQTTNQVLVRFSLTPGQSCPGYEILHSLDSINFLQIYNYAGLCGNQSTEENYSFVHSGPAPNQINYYKISIPGFETSTIRSIYVGEQALRASIFLYPNPIINDNILRLKYYNFAGDYVEGYIYNQFGMPIKPLFLSVKNQLSEIDVGELNSGLYIVWLTDGNVALRSKFIVKRT